MKKSLFLLTILTLLISCVGIFVGCEKPKPPYNVQLEVYQPNGELLDMEKSLSTSLWLKYDGNPKVFDFKVYNKDLKRYLVDDDVSDGTVNDLCRVYIQHGESTEHFPIDFENDKSWPTEVGNYDILIRFNNRIEVGSFLDDNYRIADKSIRLTIEEVQNESL